MVKVATNPETTIEVVGLNCPKCTTGTLKYDRDNQRRVCFNCGFYLRGTKEIHEFIQANKKEIIEYFNKTHDKTLTMYRFNISQTALENIPEIKIQKKVYNRRPEPFRDKPRVSEKTSAKIESRRNGHNPKLPEFNNEWDKEVQLKWLEILDRILTKGEPTK